MKCPSNEKLNKCPDELTADETLLREELSKVIKERSQLKSIMTKVSTVGILPSGSGGTGGVGGGTSAVGTGLGVAGKTIISLIVAGGIGLGAFMGATVKSSKANDKVAALELASEELEIENKAGKLDLNKSKGQKNSSKTENNVSVKVGNVNAGVKNQGLALVGGSADVSAGELNEAHGAEGLEGQEERLSTIPKNKKRVGARLESRIIHYPKIKYIKPHDEVFEEGGVHEMSGYGGGKRERIEDLPLPFLKDTTGRSDLHE
jgi:hypothetical protein